MGGRRILLINPRQRVRHYATQPVMAALMGKAAVMPPLALPLLAALTPDNYDITICDEETATVPDALDADIVGITTLSNTIDRAHQLADSFRGRGITVVLGGPHASYTVEESLAHADCVVVGEAEGSWQKLLSDFEKGTLKQVYTNDTPAAYADSPLPRWDLLPVHRYLTLPVQATRGCPYACEFCLVSKMFGRRVRRRAFDNIMAELDASPLKRLFFVDDNFTVNREFAAGLLDRMKGGGYSWITQASIDIAGDPALLELMAEAGCDAVLIGFESLNSQSLEETRKRHNLSADYEKAVSSIHAHGIHVLGSFVVGFDHDTYRAFDDIRALTIRTSMSFVTINLLGVSPGTDLYERLTAENRLISNVPAHFKGGIFPAFRYKNMSGARMFTLLLDTVEELYSFDTVLHKGMNLFGTGSFARPLPAGSAGALTRVAALVQVIRFFLFSRHRSKRRLFAGLLRLVARKDLTPGRAVSFLVSMEGFNRHIALLRAQQDRFLAEIGEVDRWEALEDSGNAPAWSPSAVHDSKRTGDAR